MRFDDDFFGPAEGNLSAPPGSFTRQTTTRRGGDYAWSRPRIPAASILLNPMRAYPSPDMPIATLDSFSAFSTSSYPPGTTNYAPATSPIAQPAVNGTGNFWQDNISGVVRAFTPAAVSAISGNNPAAMQQYLQGNSPGMTLNAQGQLVPKPAISTAMMIGIAAVGLVVLVVVMKGGKSSSAAK